MNDNVITLLARVVVLITTIPVHESAHGLVSYWLGDPTAKAQGRITLNPLKHFDLMGSICLLFAGVGWAKPVPVNSGYYKRKKLGMAITALAGPAANFMMAMISMILYKFVAVYAFYHGAGAVLEFIIVLLWTMTFSNIVLGVFNLMPFPPFDGSRIYSIFLPEKWYFGIMKYERYIFGGVILLVFFGVLDTPLGFLYESCLNLLDKATFLADYIAFVLFGK